MKTQKLTTLFAVLTLSMILSGCGEKAKKDTTDTMKMESEEMVSKEPEYNTAKPETLLASIEYAHGGWNDLWSKNDVQYTYDYRYPDGKADVSVERYIFSNEASYGNYTQHDINVMPGEKGEVTQYFDGETTKVMMDGKNVENPQVVAVSDFLRRANYFWFVMPYKLNDKGTIATYMGQEDYNNTTYDKVEITYDAAITGKEQNDAYILYVNPETKLVDRFYFSLPFLGVNAPVIIANYEYEEIEGQKIATKRTYFMPNEKGEYGEDPNIVQTLTNVKFNNGFAEKGLMN
ncbi:DUF6503 family protein [Maribacter sp. 2210JD10-5]|uniref:DUF6503 family protein n=1 Tax=Maribacter sp. 2210JD10-5 TaxID=3386272 RepID=UPI0039BCB47C